MYLRHLFSGTKSRVQNLLHNSHTMTLWQIFLFPNVHKINRPVW